MTRIFEALRKAQTSRARAAEAPVAPVAPVLPKAAGPAPHRPTAVQAVSRRSAVAARLPHNVASVIPFGGAPDLDEGIIREMTTLRMNLEAALTERIPRVVMLMSALPGEGTTTVAAQFAATLVRDERLRVLLVDLHARRSDLSALGSETSDDSGVMLLPIAGQAGDVIAPGRAREEIEQAASSYDWVVIDGPPALESPDAAPLGAMADGIVMVIQAGRTKEPVLGRAVDLLRKAGGNLIGSVLNRRRLEIPEFIYRRI